MDKLNKIGLPVVVTIMFLFIVLMKSAVNIGYGEAGVLFKTFGGGVVTAVSYTHLRAHET